MIAAPTLVRVLMLSIAMVLAISSAGYCAGYRDDIHHYSFQVPADWEELPPSFVETLNGMVRQSVSNPNVQYERAFGPKGQPPGSFPYTLVQIVSIPESGVSYEAIEKSTGAEAEELDNIGGPIGDVLADISFDKPVLERAKNRVVVHLHSNLEGFGQIHCLSIGHLGKGRIVHLHSYAPESEFTRHLPMLTSMYDSFRFDPDYQFVAQSPNPLTSIFSSSARSGAIGGAIAGGLGALLWTLAKAKRMNRA